MSRIYQYPVVTEIGNDDYLALGSATNGSRAILASDLAPVIGSKTITERGTYKASDDNMDGYGQVTVDIPYTDIHVASGDIATFEGEDLPLKSLKVAVTPYQDLHGYDSPWVGGAGKNKLNNTATSTTRNGVTFIVNANGSVTVSGTATATATLELGSLSVRQGETYTISGSISAYDSTQSQLFCRSEVAFPSGNRLQSYSGLSKTATALADETITVVLYVYGGTSVNGTFYPQIELGSTETSFAPYSNICPISGWSEANVSVCGKNLATRQSFTSSSNGGLDTNERIGNAIVGTQYTISVDSLETNIKNIRVYIGDTVITSVSAGTWTANNRNSVTFTANISGEIGLGTNRETFSNSTKVLDNIQLEIGSTATTYEPYNGATYTIDLDGTRYGGVLDVTNGTMDDTLDYIASYNGETLPSTWISDRDVYAEGTTPTIGAEVVYTRATPITVQLAPTPVKSLEGENNIFANCGAVDVEYQTVWVRPTN